MTNWTWIAQCQEIANGVRRRALSHTIVHGGYLSQACSSAEIFAALYGRVMVLGPSAGPALPPRREGPYRPDPPDARISGMVYNGGRAPDRDRFFLSPTHYALALYATLVETNRLGEAALDQFNVDGSVMEMIGSEHSPGLEVNGGSFGQTISQAAGVAWARKYRRESGLVWIFLGDGECQEGQTWEAVLSMAFHKLDNIKIIVDVNGQQVDGRTCEVMDIEPLDSKFRAFGAHVEHVDGHDLEQLERACRCEEPGKPLVILARTSPLRGIEPLKARYPNLHYVRFNSEEEKASYARFLATMPGNERSAP